MITTDQVQQVVGGTVVGEDGSKIGKVSQVYLDDQTGEPEWVTVKGGMFSGGGETFVPLAQATADGDQLRVPYGKDKVKDAPQIQGGDDHLSQEQEADLYRFYGLDYSEQSSDSGLPAGDRREDRGGDGAVGHDTSGPNTDDAMTRSEEQLHVGTQSRESGRAKLRKYVVTENVTQTVPVSHEEVRIEREPITDANRGAATSGGDITEEEHEVTLHEEKAVSSKETVPVERVRMDTETVTGEEQVSDEVRKEQIDTDQTDAGRHRQQ